METQMGSSIISMGKKCFAKNLERKQISDTLGKHLQTLSYAKVRKPDTETASTQKEKGRSYKKVGRRPSLRPSDPRSMWFLCPGSLLRLPCGPRTHQFPSNVNSYGDCLLCSPPRSLRHCQHQARRGLHVNRSSVCQDPDVGGKCCAQSRNRSCSGSLWGKYE